MITSVLRMLHLAILGMLLSGSATQAAHAQSECRFRGTLDALYCDENRDLVADSPQSPDQFINPSTLAFSYTPVEDPAIYEKIFRPFTEYLAVCTGRPVVYQRLQSNAAEIEAMRQGRLHVAGFSTGPTNYAVKQAGAVPFAAKGSDNGILGYRLLLIVKKGSAFYKPTDLKGRRVAHVQPSSNSGNLAPRALFPALGLKPDQDYKVLYSGKHDNSIAGVISGEFDGAPVASGVLERMIARGQVKEDDLRVIWSSGLFPTTAFAHAHNLEPKLRDTIIKCFHEFRYPKTLQTTFKGADRFVPITYLEHWALVRSIAAGSGERFSAAPAEAGKNAQAGQLPSSK